MPTVKITVSNPKTKTAVQKEFEDAQPVFLGKKIGDKVPGDSIGLAGIELEVTGGSDKEGFPMRKDIEGQARKRVVLSGPPGFHPDRDGKRKRKSVRGNTISADIVQINTKVVRDGQKSAEELWGVKPKEKGKKEQKPEAKPEARAGTKTEPKEQKHETKAEPRKEQKSEAKSEPKEEHKAEKPESPGKPASERAEEKMGVKKVE